MGKSRGFTLTELLIVIAIVALLLMLGFTNWRRQVDRSFDARRKDDLQKIQRAFEEYYNDNRCYPPVATLADCGGAGLSPYLKRIPCDPEGQKPYFYKPLEGGDICQGYRLLVSLSDLGDQDISRVGCSPIAGCGFGIPYNYGISMGGAVPATGFVPPEGPTPTTGPTYWWACSTLGNCNLIADPDCEPRYQSAAACNMNCVVSQQVITCE